MEDKKQFWLRFALWCAFSCLLPVAFIAWRYDLFQRISTVQFGGWGMLAIIIIAVFVFTVLKYVKRGMGKWSMTKQVIMGVAKVIVPLLALYFGLRAIQDSIALFMQALGVIIACEAIAIPLNPLPEWAYRQSKGQTEDAIDYFFQRYDERKGNQQ